MEAWYLANAGDLLVVRVAAALVGEDLTLVVQEVVGADLVLPRSMLLPLPCEVCGGRGTVQEG